MNLKEVKHRILSVKSTQKITSAMKLISAAKLHRAQLAVEGIHPYRSKLNDMLASLIADTSVVASPYIVERDVRRVTLIAVASNTSMCGGFNSNVIRKLREVVDGYKASGVEVEIYSVGKKMDEAIAKMGLVSNESLMSQAGSPRYSSLAAVATDIMQQYKTGATDRVEIVYSFPLSGSKQQPMAECLLPFGLGDAVQADNVPAGDFIVEPGNDAFLSQLLPKVITLRLFEALLDSAIAEHSARMLAMQIATDNATDLVAELTLEYNKGRQQAITNEILDIMAGSLGKS